MQKYKCKNKNFRRGAAFIIAMVFVAFFSSLGFAMLTMSSANVQISDNQRQGNLALTNAQSGLEVLRYWLDDMDVSAKDLTAVKNALALNLTNASVTNMAVAADDPTSPTSLTISTVTLDSQSSQTFSAVISQLDTDTLQVDVTGTSGQLNRTVRTNFNFCTKGQRRFLIMELQAMALY